MSLDGAYDEGNIFAKILRGEAPCVKVFEDDIALSFMDIFPQTEGHTLVIPKGVSARNYLDMPTDMIGPYMERVQKVARAVTKAMTPDGLQIMQFNGATAGQTVYHLHFHLLPRWEGRQLLGHGQAKMADKEALAQLATRIAASL
jgi:histidine triad (HIT) family protein